jgi:Family of unknown function (DUF6159)
MFERISNGWSMARSSWRVLMSDKKLLLFPIVSGILSLLVFASFAVPLAVLGEGKLLDANGNLQIWMYPIIFAFYFCSYFVVIFCNAALVSCALLKFNGQESTLGDGFRAAAARFPQILGWALVSATVGLLLKAIENVNEKIGSWVSMLLGAAWTIMTYFVVPVLVVEKVGPIEAIGRSTSLLKKTWGEAVVGKIGLGLFLMLLAIPIVLLLVIGVALLAHSPALGIIVLVAGGVAMLLYMAVSAAMNMTAVYQYAAHDRCPDGFESETIARAFGKA